MTDVDIQRKIIRREHKQRKLSLGCVFLNSNFHFNIFIFNIFKYEIVTLDTIVWVSPFFTSSFSITVVHLCLLSV